MNANRKKLNMITIGLLMLVFLFTAGTASAALVHIDPISVTVDPGDAVLMTVKGSGFLGDPAGVAGGSITLNWDPAVMSLDTAIPAAPFFELSSILDPGIARFDFTAGSFGTAGAGGIEFSFLNLAFIALAPPSTVLDVGLGPFGDWLYDDGSVELDVTYQGSTVTVVNPIPIPGAVWLLGSGLLGMVGLKRRRKS